MPNGIIVLDDGTALLRCRRACKSRTDELHAEAVVWKPYAINLSEARVIDWGQHDRMAQATILRGALMDAIIDMPFREFDLAYTNWLQSRPAFRLN